jgi:hypothetical protein
MKGSLSYQGGREEIGILWFDASLGKSARTYLKN